jgi:hypothetical protein
MKPQIPTKTHWSLDTMRTINDLTPEIKCKAFDPGWFLLRERLARVDAVVSALERIVAACEDGPPRALAGRTVLCNELRESKRALAAIAEDVTKGGS